MFTGLLTDNQHESCNSQARIALLSSGGQKWIVGVLYIHNLIRALNLLPDSERPQLYLVIDPLTKLKYYSELGTHLPTVRYYALRRSWPFWKQLGGIGLSLVEKRWPQSLERVVTQTEVKTIFPVHTSLGRRFPVPWIGWIPDFQHKRLPQFFSKEEKQFRDGTFQKIVDEAPHIVVSSQDAYRDLMHWFPTGSHKVSVLPFTTVSTPEWYEGNPKQTAEKLGLPKKYSIFPSQFWVHKNHRVVFDAIRILRDRGFLDICLVCTGYTHDYRHPEHFPSLQNFILQHNLAGHVRILGLLPRQVQTQLLRGAVAIIQPSLFEGWSALVEDARALGKRIYLSDIPIHREQNPPDAVFSPPDSAESLAELIAKDWAHLTPGPDIVREGETKLQQQDRAIVFARSFLRIVDRVTKKRSGAQYYEDKKNTGR